MAKRAMSAVLVAWLVATIVFIALRATGDPLEAILGGPGSQTSAEALSQAKADYGLDQPLIVQYFTQLGQIFTLNFGTSFSRKVPVSDLLAATLPNTLLLATLALFVAILLAIFGSMLSTVFSGRGGKTVGKAVQGLQTITTVMPEFFLGAVLILLVSMNLGWLPATSASNTPAALALPVFTLAVPISGFIGQTMRSSLEEATSSAFATSSRARGASEFRIFFTHTLRHALLSVLPLIGWAFGSLLAGAVVVESLFARPGLGRLLIDSALARDVPVVIGAVTIIALTYVVIVLITDLLEVVVDPRLRSRRPSSRQNQVTHYQGAAL